MKITPMTCENTFRRSISVRLDAIFQQAKIASASITQTVTYPCGCGGEETIELMGGAVGDYGGNHGDYTGGSYGDEN